MHSHDRLIVFLHGIGASGAQLMPLANAWGSSFPNARFAAPDAPLHHWRGHQWFSTEGNPLDPAHPSSAQDVRRSHERRRSP